MENTKEDPVSTEICLKRPFPGSLSVPASAVYLWISAEGCNTGVRWGWKRSVLLTACRSSQTSLGSCRNINVTRQSSAVQASEGFADNRDLAFLTRWMNTSHVLYFGSARVKAWRRENPNEKLRAVASQEHALGSFRTWEAHRVHELVVFFGNTTQAARSPTVGSWFPPGRTGQRLSELAQCLPSWY